MRLFLRTLVRVSLVGLLAACAAPLRAQERSVAVAPGTRGLTASLRPADAAVSARLGIWTGALGTGWSPNLGQIADADGRSSTEVLYVAEIPGAQVYVTSQGLSHFFLSRREGEEEDTDARPAGRGAREARLVDWSRLDLRLQGARLRAADARPEMPMAAHGVQNFYLPHCPDGVLNVPTYAKVTFAGVYPGIDWVVRTEPDHTVHHDFVVAPGADPGAVRLEYVGATAIELSGDGRTLIARTALGEVREGALHCYQGSPGNRVSARFRLEGNVVTVAVDDYDRNVPLVIDPPMSWYTLYGGNSFDGPNSVQVDPANGDVYVVGYTASTTMPVLNPGGGSHFQGTSGGSTDGFIWKFDQAGVRQWATYYGGSDWDQFADCALDPAGNLYVCGDAASTNFPVGFLGGAYNQAVSGGLQDAVLLKFDPLGVRLWATYCGGDSIDGLNGITVDVAGKVYACGFSDSPDFPLANPGGGAFFQGTVNGGNPGFDGVVARFAGSGALEWSTFLGGSPAMDLANSITTRNGSLYVVGQTSASNFPTLNPGGGAYFQPALAGIQDAFIARFTTAGVQQWTTYYGGGGIETGDEPVVDASGNLFVNGQTSSTDLPLYNPGGTTWFQPALAGNDDFMIAKFDASNAPVWSTYYGGSLMDAMAGFRGKTMTLDTQGRLYMTARTESADFPVLNPGGGAFFQAQPVGLDDTILLMFANDGTRLWATCMGRPAYDFGRSVGVGPTGCLFAVGESQDDAGPLGVNPGGGGWYQTVNNSPGEDEGFIARFCTPPSSCCVDFTCVPVFSAAQCTTLGGTAYHPNVPCTSSPCVSTCTICGRKFSDLDGDGVQDPGEPGLAGWTIQLLGANNAVYATAATDAQGDYCFTNLPCGNWTVAEVQQPGWVATAPAGGSHQLGLGIGTTLNGVNFANRACATTPACVGTPPGVAGRWPFDDVPGATDALDVTHASPPLNMARVQLGGGGGTGESGALCLGAPGDEARVLAADQFELDFGPGSFAIAARLRIDAGTAGPRVIVDKRAPVAGSLGGVRGWALYLVGQQAFLEIGTGGAPQVVPGPTIAADTWTHLAVSLNREGGQGLWYLDGETMAAFGFAPDAGSVTNDADLVIGQAAAAFGPSPAFQGCIDDLVLFDSAVEEPAARKAFGPPPVAWCPDFVLMPQVTSICRNRDSVLVCFKLGNNTAVPQTFQWSLAGLPAGPGCSVTGPVQFTPSAGTVVVPPGGTTAPICVLVRRPAGLTAQNATACFSLTYLNPATGQCRSRTASLRADTTCWCTSPSTPPFASVAARIATGGIIGIGIDHPCDPRNLVYRLSAQWPDTDHEDPLALSLNGLPPGTPVDGTLLVGGGSGGGIDVQVSYPQGFDPAARYELVFEADTDGDGLLERVSGTIVEPEYTSTGTVGVKPGPGAAARIRLVTQPNPFIGATGLSFTLGRPEQVEFAIHDLGGRRVRWLARGRLEAGPHRFEWDGRTDGGHRAAAGVYFVRLVAGGQRLEAKLVKAQ